MSSYTYISQGRLALKALKCIFIRYSYGVKGYRLWFIELNLLKCKINKDVVFYEEKIIDNVNVEKRSEDGLTIDVYFKVVSHIHNKRFDIALSEDVVSNIGEGEESQDETLIQI